MKIQEGKSRDQSIKILKYAALLGRSVNRTSFEMLHKEKNLWICRLGHRMLGVFKGQMSCKQLAVNIN